MAVRVLSRTDSLMSQAKELVERYAPDYTVEWDRGLRRFGVCKYASKTITISKPLTEKNSDEDFFTVVMHEIAHAMVGCYVLDKHGSPVLEFKGGKYSYKRTGHGNEWKRQMIALGQDPKRTHSAETAEPKYKGSCNCHSRYKAHRLSKRFRDGVCSNCGFTVRWVDTTTGRAVTSSIRML